MVPWEALLVGVEPIFQVRTLMHNIISGSQGQVLEDTENYAGTRQVHRQVPTSMTTSLTGQGQGGQDGGHESAAELP